MFKSLQRKCCTTRVVDAVWPRIGFKRAWSYRVFCLSRVGACPHSISLGFAAGAFASFTPFIGFHFLLAAAIALLLRGNVLASAAGTVVGNPLTFPLIWAATFQLGSFIRGGLSAGDTADVNSLLIPAATHGSGQDDWSFLNDAILVMLVGSVPVGLAGAVMSHGLCQWSFQGVRRKFMSKRSAVAVQRV